MTEYSLLGSQEIEKRDICKKHMQDMLGTSIISAVKATKQSTFSHLALKQTKDYVTEYSLLDSQEI